MGDRELIENLRDLVSSLPRTGTRFLIKQHVKELADRLEALSGLLEREGWVLVPREPTEAMLHAAQDAVISTGWDQARDCFTAMLSAAPNP